MEGWNSVECGMTTTFRTPFSSTTYNAKQKTDQVVDILKIVKHRFYVILIHYLHPPPKPNIDILWFSAIHYEALGFVLFCFVYQQQQ